jgi:hypothetical protein
MRAEHVPSKKTARARVMVDFMSNCIRMDRDRRDRVGVWVYVYRKRVGARS